ncbi:MAG: DNRLRE domain-containing protein, partial [bacterium]
TSTLPVWKSWNLTDLTQKWVNGTATNYGVILWATNEDVNGYNLRFYSSEAVQDQANWRSLISSKLGLFIL